MIFVNRENCDEKRDIKRTKISVIFNSGKVGTTIQGYVTMNIKIDEPHFEIQLNIPGYCNICWWPIQEVDDVIPLNTLLVDESINRSVKPECTETTLENRQTQTNGLWTNH